MKAFPVAGGAVVEDLFEDHATVKPDKTAGKKNQARKRFGL